MPGRTRRRDSISTSFLVYCSHGAHAPISEVKTHLPALLTGVERREEEIVVTRKGRPAAVLLNFSEYERLKATVDVLSDAALMRQVRRGRRYFAAGGKGKSLEQVFGDAPAPPRARARRR